ncbi:MFS transporter [Paenibacillus hexagrammi]|uniref:MFS transporter n=1 Tax=Paenibacillus hexagrammi TaxID=2908839 RepID=UPI003312FA06
MALVGDLYKGATESKALGLTEASNGAGKVLSPIIGSLLALIVWFTPFFAFPIFCVLSLLAVIFIIKEPKQKKKPQPLKQYIGQIGSILKKREDGSSPHSLPDLWPYLFCSAYSFICQISWKSRLIISTE